MKTLVALLLLLPSLALSYPAGPANSVVRVPPAGGPVTTGAVDLTKSAAVTGLGANAIPFWNGVGAVGLGNSNCTWNSGTLTLTCGDTVIFSGLASANFRDLRITSTGQLESLNTEVVSARFTAQCTVSPCAFAQEPNVAGHSAFNTITRGALGSYTVNFTGGFWSVAPICRATPFLSVFFGVCNITAAPTTASFTFACARTTNAVQLDIIAFISCQGQR